jgi:lipid II:glycine glycyltransferase (peptidoglycan interpeptide bridge formation enzyme)
MFAVPGNRIRIAAAHLHGKVIGAVLVSYYRATAACLYAGIDYEYRNAYPSNLLQSEVIRDLIEQGFSEYSLGTSRGLRDVERFKETLGAVRHESVVLCRYGYRRLKNVASAFRSQSWARSASRRETAQWSEPT